ncbi:FadR/GntR family transcriptional regulator [Clostridium boliviensis]|uniref:FadR/GntR family transcriptional regulator n=1 Tax=Clostridium boliviensis TaxID=318465 RepID=A0ABU4GLF5_9CLOT|nr:FadR/GntR family transcriptional regulator [Clostridium boliviensis]MDW2798443.1 FadR/GntR family transcriptional regulator [Clostridium boliviensis]
MASTQKSLADVTAERIIKYIIDNKLKEGGQLPNETALSSLMGVGRSTLREAIRSLASRNILTVQQGSGIYVSHNTGVADDPLGFTFIENKEKLVADLMEFRMMIEPRSAALAASKATPEQAQELLLLAADVENCYEKGVSHSEADALFHAKIAEISENVILPQLEPLIMHAIDMFIDITHSSLKEETIKTHKAIVNAIQKNDPIAAQDAMTLHLIYNRDRLRNTLAQK